MAEVPMSKTPILQLLFRPVACGSPLLLINTLSSHVAFCNLNGDPYGISENQDEQRVGIIQYTLSVTLNKYKILLKCLFINV